jgi:hypothetical protein
MASLANSPTQAFINKEIPAQSNCKLTVYTIGRTAKLTSGNTRIRAGSEIIWWYNNSYEFPNHFN